MITFANVHKRRRFRAPVRFAGARFLIGCVLILLGAAGGRAQSVVCIDYGDYIHWASGTALPFAPAPSQQGSVADVRVVEHPFVPGHQVAFCCSNEYILNTSHQGYLTAVDVTDPLALGQAEGDGDEIGAFTLTGAAHDMAVDPGYPARPYLYLATSDLHLQVIEVTDPDPLDPQNLDLGFTEVFNAPESPGLSALDPVAVAVQVRGGQTLAFTYESGNPSFGGSLRVYDVTTPGAPVLLSTFSTGNGTSRDLLLNGDIAYVTHHFGGLILDVSDPSAPSIIGSLNAPLAFFLALSEDGNVLYMTSGNTTSASTTWGLSIYDVSMPTAPVLMAQPGLAQGFEQTGNPMVIRGDRLYTNTSDGIVVADISDPAQTHVIARAEASGWSGSQRAGVDLWGDYAFSACVNSGLQVVDIAADASPAALGIMPGSTTSVQTQGDLLLSGTGELFDVSDPQAPVLLSTIKPHDDAELVDNFAFTAKTDTIRVWDLSVPTAPVQVASVRNYLAWNGQIVAFHQNGSPLITVIGVGNQGNGYLYTFDPLNPGAFARTGSTFGGRAVDLDHACGLVVATRTSGFDLFSPSQYYATVYLGIQPDAVDIYGDYLFVTLQYEGVLVYDISDRTLPVLLTVLRVPDRLGDFNVEASDGILYVAQGYGGVWVVDITDPAQPVAIGDVNPTGASYPAGQTAARRGLAVQHGALWFADKDNGIFLLPPQCGQPQAEQHRLLTATATAGGSISPSGTIEVPYGCGYHAYVITPDPGYSIEQVLVDGVPVGPVADYVFTDVTEDHAIEAQFTMDPVANTLRRFEAVALVDGVRLAWAWGNPGEIVSTTVERGQSAVGPWLPVDGAVALENGELTLTDRSAPADATVWYRLAATTSAGTTVAFEPVAVQTLGASVFYMAPVHPNPAVASASVRLSLPSPGHVRVSIYDVRGREVAVVADGSFAAGSHEFTWTGATAAGRAAAGMYFVRARGERQEVTRSLILSR